MSDKKLNVGLFIDSYFPIIDGVVMVVDNYARLLSKYCNVTVFTAKAKGYDDSNLPYKVVRCKYFKLPKLGYSVALPKMDRKFKKQLKESNLDLVHIHAPFAVGKMGVKYAKEHNIPVIATMHSQFKRDFYKATNSKWITNIMLKKIMKVFNACHECWAVNDEVANVYVEYGARVKPKVQNNGTDMQTLTDMGLIENLKKEYAIKEDEKVFLFVGRIIEIKNIFLILDSLKEIKDKGFKFKMFYIGDGPDVQRLQEKIDKYNLNNEVMLVGRVSDRLRLTTFYAMADLFLFPSLYDCSSLVQIEASSQYTPTLFVYGSVTSATVEEDVTGYFSENNVEDFANKIVSIFENKELYNTVSKNVHEILYKPWDKAIEKVYLDYVEVLDTYTKYNTKD